MQKMHPLRECPLNVVSICGLCEDNHYAEDCPSFPGLQVVFKQVNETVNPPLQSTQRKSWQPRMQVPQESTSQ